MTWQDVILIIELIILAVICYDDHLQRRMAEESLRISRESLEAQKQYLDLRRKWYEQRNRKKEEKLDNKDIGKN
jgi:predicted Holliday junction resolvase-like endonuclease